ncbi:MAG: 2-amino-4-hydroxy-6-hydroxymethyldihydropteridine diphosphokinase [Bacteroidales bacterium]|nr:2-amino-4-hydroxy-6-hydroxymethyldihydropteridine diphosphokinase [Bacteroidales bacterium]MDD2425240.1 2-amino-4-hydroxy-6-hydroxymethyldihydropteridine diphosphokinase [Bacteroidales bacterium]MDD3988929.1 2-amino-4-hydroxy-6-hydroxymethyldihydropteridine diphosphokinase [Bacteroidales bacterium]MDD4638783.1 2-amino-4-hydroxy-6-hydroxymethyldihydropteridine diphosphokinase [Bacteroidales bacterium]
MKDVFLLLGSNIGERKPLIERTLQKITMLPATIIAHSSLYETEPWGFDSEDWFVNMAVWIQTEIEPHQLMEKLLMTESCLGRERKTENEVPQETDAEKYQKSVNNGEKERECHSREHQCREYHSRTIDIDILFYSDYVIDTDNLQIPHPRLHLRNFALIPLAEIAGEFTHPVLNLTINQLVEKSPDKSRVIKLHL